MKKCTPADATENSAGHFFISRSAMPCGNAAKLFAIVCERQARTDYAAPSVKAGAQVVGTPAYLLDGNIVFVPKSWRIFSIAVYNDAHKWLAFKN